MNRIRVKICCISSVEEARLAINYGASAVGLVGRMPSGPGVIGDEDIKKIASTIPPPISTFLLSSETRWDRIVEHHRKAHTTTIQIVDALKNRQYAQIREQLPGIKLVQVIHVLDDTSVREAVEISHQVDALLLDSGNPNLAVKVLGGTGRTHNWDLSRKINELTSIPLFLAGGLSSQNVVEAIEKVEPFGVDLCSSVRSNGNLDESKLEAFFRAVGN
jgi:phosphoribosylanthranilate isomerase